MSSRLRRCVVEALGTFALVVIGCGASVVSHSTHAFDHAGVAMGFGAAVALIVASSGHLSGAHVNPAVTIGFWSMRRFPARDVVPYIVAQCLGAIAASFTLAWVLGTTGGFGETVPSISVARAFVVEAGYSGLLAFVIMGVATEPKTPPAAHHQTTESSTKPPKLDAYGLDTNRASKKKSVTRPVREFFANSL